MNTAIDSIELNNNYNIQIINSNKEKTDKEAVDIQNLNLSKVIRNKKLMLNIDFKKISKKQYKRVLKKLLFIKNITSKINIEIGKIENNKKIVAYLINFDNTNQDQNDFIQAINAIFYNTKYERYNYIYDTVCNYLDNYFYGKNLCDFKNNKCGEKINTSSTTGCCHHFKNKWIGPLSKLVLCEYLKEDYTCGAKCISCKLFTCDYLEKKGIKFRIKDILLLDVFFNSIQKYFIKYMVFTPKEKIIKRLMKL